ncbi:riboflavin synthase [Pseudalkalibacillus caeni]|uniref:Riboflavin synthase n=1 Tax=Exobacillus caeni TaxID=2574798 RepID=A0A5R9EX52_9BACL|nr:riboflavin synthase [Pseudalkalibacillus caeni]TLS35647.1 riboflavin synthase [Pseudalkalibacillus caeni]
MFTGIVEEIGSVNHIDKTGEAIQLAVGADRILRDVKLGDSISVNGVCLTVTDFTSNQFSVDVMPETFRATSLRDLKVGGNVNLERAMAANGRFGGHFVSGHIDGTGTIIRKEPSQNAVYYDIKLDEELIRYMALKGSVAVDGTSLTIFGVTNDAITISLIPHTLSETILGNKEPGDIVNIECDMLAKYMERFLERRLQDNPSTLSSAFLEEHGFK